MKKLLPLAAALILGGCCGVTSIDSYDYESHGAHESPWPFNFEMEDCGYVDGTEMSKIIIEYSAVLKKKHRLFLEDSRIYYDDKIKKLRLDYYSQGIIEICEARQVIVDIVDGFLERINGSSIVGFQTDPKPFGYENLEVHVTYGSYFILHVDSTYIAHLMMEDGIVWYLDGELDDKNSDYWMKRIESYPKTRELALIDREVQRMEEEEKKANLEAKRKKSLFTERFVLED